MRKQAWLALMWVVAGCSDPSEPKYWIKRLDDPNEAKDAVRELVKMKNPVAIAPLSELYKKKGDVDVLKAIASFADKSSVPLLRDALEFSEDSFDRASVAATALGEIGDLSALDDLAKAATKTLQVKSRANVVRVEAIKALRKMKDPRAVPALIKVLTTPADEQDFMLNQASAIALGAIRDSRGVPALVRGLFMQGRGTNIYQECRAALVGIGEPSVDKLIEAMQRLNPDLEEDAKKYEFLPGIVVDKTAAILGDIRSSKAVDALLAQLDKKDMGLEAQAAGKDGLSEHQSVLTALGKIGDPRALKTLTAILADKKRHVKERIGACDGLNMLGDTSAIPALLGAANTQFVDARHVIDPEAANLAASGAVNYGRLAVADTNPDVLQKIPPKPGDDEDDFFADIRIQFQAAKDRIAVGKTCGADMACYDKMLSDKDANKAEKAAFMLSRLPAKAGLPTLCKNVGVQDQLARLTILFGIARLGDKTSTECLSAIEKQIGKDDGKPQPYRMLVSEMKTVRAQLSR